ncbi:MAG: DUF3500 domain-containing protein, partial [Chloroflexota bacterium]
MLKSLSRREFLKGAFSAGALLALPRTLLTVNAQSETIEADLTTAELITATSAAAATLIDAVEGAQRDNLMFTLDDPLSLDWNWTFRQSRPGLELRTLSEAQADAALELVATGMSEDGYTKALDIMALQTDLGNDPLKFYVRIFGEPGSEHWGWSFLGHHLTINTRIVGDEIFTTPMFLGARPTVTTRDGESYRVMTVEELTARDLVLSLGSDA